MMTRTAFQVSDTTGPLSGDAKTVVFKKVERMVYYFFFVAMGFTLTMTAVFTVLCAKLFQKVDHMEKYQKENEALMSDLQEAFEDFIGNEEETDALIEALGGALTLGAIVASEGEEMENVMNAFGGALALGNVVASEPEEIENIINAFESTVGFGHVLNTMPEEETDALIKILLGSTLSTIAKISTLFNGDLEDEDEVDAVIEILGEGLGYIADFFCELQDGCTDEETEAMKEDIAEVIVQIFD